MMVMRILLPLLCIIATVAWAKLHPLVHTCPPCDCFNCNDPSTPCLNGGQCDAASGRCTGCPAGFAGGSCGDPLCGSLPVSTEHRPLKQPDGPCECDAGFVGVNCNVCQEDKACSGLLPPGIDSKCYQGAVMRRRAFKSCGARLPPFYRRLLGGQATNATTECRIIGKFIQCDMQFWVNHKQQFWCNLHDCTTGERQHHHQGNITYGCAKATCACIPGAKLCSRPPFGLINLQPMLAQVRGPASFTCDDAGDCTFQERTLNDYFAKGIELTCLQGECLRNDELPGILPSPTNGWSILAWVFGSTVIITGLLIVILSSILRHRQSGAILLVNPEEETRQLMESHVPSTLAFSDLSYRLSPESDEESGSSPALLLSGVSGIVHPGEVMAIIGGSGAGKTTCLDILAQKLKRGVCGGQVVVNGQQVRGMPQMSGFVDQEVKLFGTLTVHETLLYSALLRLPKSMSLQAKQLRVQQTMIELGIEHLADTRIGTPGRRGLSGGEQRRVAIACELVTAPRILFLDEPTSGLDAHSAFAVVEALVRMARQHHRTVVLTIHQPRSNIFCLFDRLLLLATGRMVYSGPTEDAAGHFASLGFAVPPGFNTADFLIDITMDASVEYSHGQLLTKVEEDMEREGGEVVAMEESESAFSERSTLLQPTIATASLVQMFRNWLLTKTGHYSPPHLRHLDTALSRRIGYLEDEFGRSEAGQNLASTLPEASSGRVGQLDNNNNGNQDREIGQRASLLINSLSCWNDIGRTWHEIHSC